VALAHARTPSRSTAHLSLPRQPQRPSQPRRPSLPRARTPVQKVQKRDVPSAPRRLRRPSRSALASLPRARTYPPCRNATYPRLAGARRHPRPKRPARAYPVQKIQKTRVPRLHGERDCPSRSHPGRASARAHVPHEETRRAPRLHGGRGGLTIPLSQSLARAHVPLCKNTTHPLSSGASMAPRPCQTETRSRAHVHPCRKARRTPRRGATARAAGTPCSPAISLGALQLAHEVGDCYLQRVGDPLRGRDGWRVPSTLDLAEVLGVHTSDAVGDLLKRLAAPAASLPHGRAEPLRDRISGRTAWHERARAGGTLHPQSRDAPTR
jgi:hypothetical protein